MPMILLYACLAQHCACCLHLGYVWVLIDPLRRDVEENARAMNDCQLGRIELREAPESYVPFSIWISFSFPRKEFSRHGFTFLILPRSLKTQSHYNGDKEHTSVRVCVLPSATNQ